jgi:PAS domain S-box-containing protein
MFGAVSAQRIAVVGNAETSAPVIDVLRAAGLEVGGHERLVLDGVVEPPALVVVVAAEAASLVAQARAAPPLADVPILAVIRAAGEASPAAVTAALAAGATDTAHEDDPPATLVARASNLLLLGRLRGPYQPGGLGPVLARVNDLLAARGDDARALVETLELVREALAFDRASLIAHIEGSPHAFVIAATDDPDLTQFALLVSDYPEVAEAIRTGAPVLIDDVTAHGLTRAAVAKRQGASVAGAAVFPVAWRGRPLGAILLRRAGAGVQHLRGRASEFARLIASLTAAHLRHGAVLESLRDPTHRVSRLRYEAERRLRGIDSLKEHFEAAADGVVIVDEHGAILFVNRAGERITGFAREGLSGQLLVDLVAPESTTVVAEAVARVLAGGNVLPFDVELATTTGGRLMVSVSTSTVLAATGAAIFTFRDVTAQRALEAELRATKEFLERLIDSTVDAIVAADMNGQLILFNHGAERLFGYRAEDVIGRLPVWELYDQGVSDQIMRMLRSSSHGGVGFLEQTRREVRSVSGEPIPVNMTASIIYEDGEEAATVGIYSDLRERIRIEQRLLQAQEKLEVSEKQAVVAALAGSAAHELNQPLTSILGYAELIERIGPPGASHLGRVAIIRSEAERMADIVKKIGRITRYELMPYVGRAAILDLERSTATDIPVLTDDEIAAAVAEASTRDAAAARARTRTTVPPSSRPLEAVPEAIPAEQSEPTGEITQVGKVPTR